MIRGANLGILKDSARISSLVQAGANCIRWNLVRPGYENVDPETYWAWLDSEIASLVMESSHCNKIISLFTALGAPFFPTTLQRAQFRVSWVKIVSRLRHDTSILGWDLANEPRMSARAWYQLASSAIEVIRREDRKRPIWVSSLNGSPLNLVKIRNPQFSHYTFHMYEPMLYTHQGVLPGFPAPVAYVPGAATKILKAVRAWQKKHRVKLFVGEFSVTRFAPDGEKYLDECLTLFHKWKWDYCYHAWRESDYWDLEQGDPKRLEVVKKWWKA